MVGKRYANSERCERFRVFKINNYADLTAIRGEGEKMKNKFEMSFAAFLAIVVAVIGLVMTVVVYVQRRENEKSERQATNVIPDWVDTAEETEPNDTQLDETEIVFEAIEEETETETIIRDTSGVSPQMNEETKPYSDDDLMYLAKIVQNEAGCDFCTDEHQRAVASVVINRVNDARFPDTIYGVISQGWNGECPLQYNVGSVERFNSLEPSERALANAQYVLEHGSTVDGGIWQAEFIQGEIVAQFAYPEIYSVVTYICK